ncbi:oligosaccharide flippase family protein [Methylotenera versatilis]|uniref:oligosaccharide flippase family protein n=1 Tax=Methylotenera versatilis TaxID=1055487 RepID=UPI00064690A8|nr:oligosaccharide flippase family protein [Methylotenera versatilis]
MLNKHSLWSLAGGAVPAVAALVSIPLMISILGFDLFAIVSLIISITIFFYVYDLGMSRTMTYLISKTEPEDSTGNDDLIGTALISASILGLIVTVVVFVLVPYFAKYWMKINHSLLDEAISAFQVSALGILPGVIANTFKGILEGKSKFREANICKMISGASIFIAPMIVIILESKSLVYISLAIVFTRYIALFIYYLYTTRLPSLLRVSVSANHFRSIWKYGVWAALSGLISTTFVYGDRFMVAGYLSAEDLSAYIASQDVLIRYLLIPWSMAIVLMPIFAANNMAKIKILELYRTQQKRVAIISFGVLLIAIFLVLFLASFVSHSAVPESIVYVAPIQTVGIFFCAMSQLPLIYLYGKGMPKLVTKIYLVELLIYILIAPVIFSNFGVIGACLVWSCRLVIEYLLLRYFAERLIR